jgi:hypothetical protein
MKTVIQGDRKSNHGPRASQTVERSYLDEVRAALAENQEPPQPTTRSELRDVLAEFPAEAWRFRPSPQVLRIIGLPVWWGRPIPPLDPYERQRLLATPKKIPAWGRAFAVVVREACAE